MNEARFKQTLKAATRALGGHCQPIESSTGSGIPDLNLYLPGVGDVWIETKVGPEALLRREQLIWLYDRGIIGGKCGVMLLHGDDVKCWPGILNSSWQPFVKSGKYFKLKASPSLTFSLARLNDGLIEFARTL